MPCHVEVTAEEREEEARKHFRHNSDVAEILCAVCTAAEKDGLLAEPRPNVLAVPGLIEWWQEHKARDEKKAKLEKKEAAYQRKLKAWEAKKPKR